MNNQGNTILNQIEYRNLEVGLEKISRDTGEDEDDLIDLLRFEKDIWITSEKLECSNQNLKILYILEPIDKNRLNLVRSRLIVSLTPLKLENFITEINKDGKFYIKYPFTITKIEITDNVYEDLVEEHGILLESFTLNDWEYIQELEIWEKCEIQVARELIALKLCEELKIFP